MKNQLRVILLAVISGAFASCSFVNMFKGPDDFHRNYSADLLKRIIDDSVREELAKEPPNGWKTEPYSPAQWDSYWNGLINSNGSGEVHKAYRGPTQQEWVRYIIQSRKAAGLRRLNIEPRNKRIVEQAMDGNLH